MKNYETAKAIRAELLAGTANEETRATYRAIRKTYAAHRDILIEAHTNSDRPAATVAALVESIGYENAAEIIAIMIICKGEWDARIDNSRRAWAAELVTLNENDIRDALGLYYSDSIHPAHMDQIARAMMAYTPTEPETAENATETAETAEATDSTPESETPAESEKKPFPHLSEELRKEYETRRKNAAHFVQFGFMPSWAEEHRTDPDRGLKQYSTPAKWAVYRAGTLSREKAVEIATRRALKEVSTNEQKQIAKMETAANAPRLEWCQIAVEWVKNSYWGNNPHATATAANMTTYGKASGCGYDKQSAAVAEALNTNPAIMRALYEAAEKALAEGNRPERYSNGNYTWRDVLGYGSGYSLLPYFEGGVGVSCFWSILEKCGFVCRCGASSRRFDSYTINRAEEVKSNA